MRIFSGLRVILFGVLCAAATLVARAGETVYHSDVVVLGSGAAGLSAAVAAAETGAKVMVLEKMPVVGGSSVFAADYVTAIGKRAEAVAGKELSVESLYKEIVRSGGGRNDPELIEKLLLMTDDAYEWLTSMGASLARPVPVREGGEWAGFRTDTKGTTVGVEVVKALLRSAEDRRIPIETLAPASEILMEKGAVAGVRVTDMRGGTFVIRSPAVVIATGSYAANPDMVRMHAGKESRQYTALNFTTNAPGWNSSNFIRPRSRRRATSFPRRCAAAARSSSISRGSVSSTNSTSAARSWPKPKSSPDTSPGSSRTKRSSNRKAFCRRARINSRP